MIAIIVNGSYVTEASRHQSQRLVEEFNRLGIEAQTVINKEPVEVLSASFPFKAAVYLDKDINFARLLESRGVRLYNSSKAIENADSKAKTVISLAAADEISLPESIVAPKIYRGAQDKEYLKKICNILQLPLVVKESYGSLGQQVYLADSFECLCGIANKIGANEHIYQRFIKESCGRSLRVFVVGGKVSGAMRLINQTDFRSNAAAGGRAEQVHLSEEQRKAAINAARILNLDFCGVDLFDTEKPILIEVNSNSYFKSIESLGFNIAGEIARFVAYKEELL